MDEIFYISDMLMNKAYNYVKYGLDILYIYPNNPSKWTFFNQESMFIYMRRHYKTINITQAAKNKLDTLSQNKCNY
jgi:hypothetical protein